mgnify:CR=1 FL=1
MWYPPSKQQIESNTNPFRALTPEQMRQKMVQEIEEAKKVKVPSKLLKDFQKEIKSERDYQFAGTDSKEDKKEIIADEKELLKVLKFLQKGQIEKAYDQFDRLDTALQDVVPQRLLQFMDQNLDESILESLDEIVRAKDKYPEIDKIKAVMKKKGIGFYTSKGKIMVNPANVVEARSALNKAFGGQFEKKTGMEVKADKRQSISDETELDEATKKQNGEKARKVLTSAKVPHSMVMGTIRVPERFVRIAKEKLDDAFGGMFQKKTGFKVSGTMKEDVQLDEGSAKDKRMMKSVKDKLTKAGIKNAVMFGEVHVAPDNVKEAEKIVGDMPFKVVPQKKLEEMSAKDHYRKVMRGGRGKGFVVSSPIDRERYPDREREGLEGPYKSRKSGKIFYYDKKAGKYYDPDSDMYLDVSDVMEGTELAEWWEEKVNSRSRGWKNGKVAVNFKTFTSGGKYVTFKKGDPIFYHPMEIKGHGGRKYKVVIAADSIADEDSYFSVHPDRLGLKGFDSATGSLKDHVELDEATRHTVYVETDRAGYRKLEKLIASLDGYQESEFEKEGKATFTFDAKKHDGAERKKVAEFIKSVKGVEFSHAIKEDTELTEAWTADSVKRNADIGSDSGYGINIKKRGSITKTPYKHMLMLRTSAKKIKVRFDHGKDEFVGSPEQVADHLNRILGIKENPEYEKELSDMNIGEINEKVMRPMGLPGKFPPKGKFTKQQIDALRKEYAKIGSVDPSSKTYGNLTDFLDSLSDDMIKQLSTAKIKFISGLALNRAVRRGLKDSYEFDSKTGEYIRADGEDPLGIDGSLGRQVKESVELDEAADEVAARELTLYIENDASLYRQRIQPIIKNLARKMKKGTFDAELAQKGFMYAVEHGLKNYNKEFGPGFKIDKDTKKKVAQDLLDNFMDEIEDAAS